MTTKVRLCPYCEEILADADWQTCPVCGTEESEIAVVEDIQPCEACNGSAVKGGKPS